MFLNKNEQIACLITINSIGSSDSVISGLYAGQHRAPATGADRDPEL